MKHLLRLAVCCLTFLLVQSQRKPCVSPSQLEGGRSVLDSDKRKQVYGSFSYDALGRRVRFVEQFVSESIYPMELLFLYKQSTGFRFHPHNKTCEKFPLTAPFPTMGIPPNSTFLTPYTLGGASVPEQGLALDMWSGICPDTGVTLMTSVTENGCLPVSLFYDIKDSGWIIVSYTSMTTGIRDPSVFTPPPECH
uniref:Ependymin n=1 Tax=Callorhinchus milii TaxID=7868 RepID=V9LCP1_CALMI